MKRLSIFLFSLLAVAAATFAQDKTELLKQKNLFKDYAKFDNPAVFANLQNNANLIADYESRLSDFKDTELFPIAMAYMATRNVDKAMSLLQKHIKAVPQNAAAIRSLATMNLIKNDKAAAEDLYKKASDMGDKTALKSLASLYIMERTPKKVEAYIDALKALAKDDLEAANIILMYSSVNETKNEALAKSVLANLNLDEIFKTASVDSFNTALNIYGANPKLWDGECAVIPARAAAINSLWFPASEAYQVALKANPNSTIALKGKALVEYRTGDVNAAFKLINKALKLGDKSAYNDLVELSLISKHIQNIDAVKDKLAAAELRTQPKFMLVQYAIANNAPDYFYMGALGKNSEALYKDEVAKKIIRSGLEKFGGDARAKEVEKLLK